MIRPPRTPKTNPPTCAAHATPEFGSTMNCDRNQNPSNSHAGTGRKNTKKPRKITL